MNLNSSNNKKIYKILEASGIKRNGLWGPLELSWAKEKKKPAECWCNIRASAMWNKELIICIRLADANQCLIGSSQIHFFFSFLFFSFSIIQMKLKLIQLRLAREVQGIEAELMTDAVWERDGRRDTDVKIDGTDESPSGSLSTSWLCRLPSSATK